MFSDKELKRLNPNKIPAHIAIIMDGNRRWAKKHLLPVKLGHLQGVKSLIRIVEAAAELQVKVLTVYAFSTENWGRSSFEVKALIDLFKHFLIQQRNVMIKKGVRLSIIGEISKFPESVQNELHKSMEATSQGKKIELVLALNYGARDEITRSVIRIVNEVEEGKLSKSQITEEVISKYLDTRNLPDPDLFIRTSGEQRVSNFLLWQISYAEIYLTQALWPDFTEKDLLEAICDFQTRQRRRGK